jgi:hypothetical protein
MSLRLPVVRMRNVAAALLALAAGAAWGQAVDSNNRDCLETVPTGMTWRGTSQLYCLKPDPMRTRRDAFGRCQERRFEITLKNNCEFLIEVRWRFDNGTPEQHRTLGPDQAITVDCGQLSERCDGSVVATAERVAN